MDIIRVRSEADARQAAQFIFEAIKPGSYADSNLPIPSLKDQLAWLSWANIRREEQPSFIVKDGDQIIAGIFGEPVEQWFDEGEAEIQEVLVLPGKESDEIYLTLLKQIDDFYAQNKAKQSHFWVLKSKYDTNSIERWQQIAIEQLGYAYNGFERVSKWSGQPVLKIEKLYS